MGLGPLPVGCLTWGDPTLEPTPALWWGRWQTLGGLTPRSTSQNLCCQCPCPHGETEPPPASAGDPPNTSRYVWFSLYGVTAPSPGSLCALQEWSLFPPVLSKSCNQIPLAFKVWFSRNSSSCFQTPRFGSLLWGSEPSLQWVDFCGKSVLQFVGHPASSYGIWFYCDCTPPTISLWLLLCLWMWGIFCGEFQCLPVDDCPAASCDSGVLARGSESMSFYSAILVPPPQYQHFNVGFIV